MFVESEFWVKGQSEDYGMSTGGEGCVVYSDV